MVHTQYTERWAIYERKTPKKKCTTQNTHNREKRNPSFSFIVFQRKLLLLNNIFNDSVHITYIHSEINEINLNTICIWLNDYHEIIRDINNLKHGQKKNNKMLM